MDPSNPINLLDLPSELLELIFFFLNDDAKVMWSMTCKRLFSFMVLSDVKQYGHYDGLKNYETKMILDKSFHLQNKITLTELFSFPLLDTLAFTLDEHICKYTINVPSTLKSLTIFNDSCNNRINTNNADQLEYLNLINIDELSTIKLTGLGMLKHLILSYEKLNYQNSQSIEKNNNFFKTVSKIKTLKSLIVKTSVIRVTNGFRYLNGLKLTSLHLYNILLMLKPDITRIFEITTLKKLILKEIPDYSNLREYLVDLRGITNLTKLSHLELCLPFMLSDMTSAFKVLTKMKSLVIKSSYYSVHKKEKVTINMPKLIILKLHWSFKINMIEGIEKSKNLKQIGETVIMPSLPIDKLPMLTHASIRISDTIPTKEHFALKKLKILAMKGKSYDISFVSMLPNLEFFELLEYYDGGAINNENTINAFKNHKSLRFVSIKFEKSHDVTLPWLVNEPDQVIHTKPVPIESIEQKNLLLFLINNNKISNILKTINGNSTSLALSLVEFYNYYKSFNTIDELIKYVNKKNKKRLVVKIRLMTYEKIFLDLWKRNDEWYYNVVFCKGNELSSQKQLVFDNNMNHYIVLQQNGFKCVGSHCYESFEDRLFIYGVDYSLWVKNKSFVSLKYDYINNKPVKVFYHNV